MEDLVGDIVCDAPLGDHVSIFRSEKVGIATEVNPSR